MRQRDSLSPTLFNLILDNIINSMKEIKENNSILYCYCYVLLLLCYVSDITLFEE